MTNSINTKTFDHIVHLTPPGTVEATAEQFRQLGLNVIPGGVHTDGLTANSLVVFADGVYFELISFTHPASHYPPGSPEREKRDSHKWAGESPGWIDYANLGNGSFETRISDVINNRAKEEGSGVMYRAEINGGRARPDGKELKWVITAPQPDETGILPFFCGDITPREWRVPADPPSNTAHPSKAKGIAHICVLTGADNFDTTTRHLTSVVGNRPEHMKDKEAVWIVDTPEHKKTKLILRKATDLLEMEFVKDKGTGIYEVGLLVGTGGQGGSTQTPYGRITWVLE